MSETPLKGILDVSMDKLRTMVDADTVIGTPITLGKVTLIPVSKVAFGLATGGSDFSTKLNGPVFGGGSGAGVTVTPVAFISVSDENVRILPVTTESTIADRIIAAAPEIIEKIKDTLSSQE